MSKKSILVLGGSSGIGLDSAKYLENIGYNVFIASRKSPENCTLKHIYVDINEEESIKKLFEYLKEKSIELYGLVYSIGITKPKNDIRDFDEVAFNKIFKTNVTGVLLTLKYAYDFLKQRQGRIVIINSIAAKTYSKISGVEYTISKAALSGLVKQLAMEFSPDKVLINSIYPSMVNTNMLQNVLTEDEIKDLSETIPLKRLLDTDEIAKTIAFLLDEELSYITGSGIDINGGLYLNG